MRGLIREFYRAGASFEDAGLQVAILAWWKPAKGGWDAGRAGDCSAAVVGDGRRVRGLGVGGDGYITLGIRMSRQVLTSILDRATLETELDEIVRYFTHRAVESCGVLFGFAWGMEYYPGSTWEDEEIPFSELRRKVEEVEASGIGCIGRDDLFLKVEGVEFQFCHDGDLHIHFEQPGNAHVEAFFERWKALGYSPAEWVTAGAPGPGEKVR